MTTILTVRAMLTFKKKYSGRARNKPRGAKIKIGGQCPLCLPPAGDVHGSEVVDLLITLSALNH